MAAHSHWVKIDRALEHIDALDASVKAWLGKNPYTVREETGPYVDSDGHHITNLRRHALVLRMREPFPREWSALVGDAVHNLRSSLDHLAFALNAKGYAEANNGAVLPESPSKASQFPIIGHGDRKRRTSAATILNREARRRLQFAHPDALPLVKRVQPYLCAELTGGGATTFQRHPLWLVSELDNTDKHRELVLAALVSERQNYRRFTIADGGLRLCAGDRGSSQ
jgi:hypothetical protein